MTVQKTLVYLAAPYSDPDGDVRLARFEATNWAASFFMKRGLHIFSPISHSHPIALAGGLPTGWDYWEGYDTAILSFCRAFVILMLPGWDRSVGVAGELGVAEKLGIRVCRVLPKEDDIVVLAGDLLHSLGVAR